MSETNLFRINFTDPDPRKPEEFIAAERMQSFSQMDEAVSKYFNVHIFDVPFSELKKDKRGWIGMYGRDVITEWGDVLYVNPWLLHIFLSRFQFFQKSPFKQYMERLEYKKRIAPHEILAKGGLHIVGDEFVLMSDMYKSQAKRLQRIARKSGLDIPIYFVPSLSDLATGHTGHIDCDYHVIDPLRIIYGSHNLFHSDKDDANMAKKKLEEIAKKHRFEVREYKAVLDETPKHVDFDSLFDYMTKRGKGLNSIRNDGSLLTTEIHQEEKEFLQRRGLEIILIPLGKVSPGAGLRCVYGQFSL